MALLGPLLVCFADELLEMSSVLKQILELSSERVSKLLEQPLLISQPPDQALESEYLRSILVFVLVRAPELYVALGNAEPILNWALQQTQAGEHDGFGSYLVRCRRQALLERIVRLKRPVAKPTCGLGVESLDGLSLSTNLDEFVRTWFQYQHPEQTFSLQLLLEWAVTSFRISEIRPLIATTIIGLLSKHEEVCFD